MFANPYKPFFVLFLSGTEYGKVKEKIFAMKLKRNIIKCIMLRINQRYISGGLRVVSFLYHTEARLLVDETLILYLFSLYQHGTIPQDVFLIQLKEYDLNKFDSADWV